MSPSAGALLLGIISLGHTLQALPFSKPIFKLLTKVLTTAQAALLGPNRQVSLARVSAGV